MPPAASPASRPATTVAGLVVARYRREFLVEDAAGTRHRCLAGRRELRPLVGDRIRFSLPGQAGDTGRIEHLEPRDNCLERIDSRGRSEPLAANLTQLVVVVAPQPAPDALLVDRYLCAARLLDLAACIVSNKADLAERRPPQAVSTGAAVGLEVDLGSGELLAEYRALGYEVIECSALAGAGLAALARRLAGEVSSLVGQSGVGKSSLVNRLVPGATQAVGEVSARSGEGRHTTTTALAHRLDGGGMVIDFPGVRGYSPPLPPPARVQQGFCEIASAAPGCRFANCLHQDEPDCAVKQAIATGAISARRYASYLELLRLAAKFDRPDARRRR